MTVIEIYKPYGDPEWVKITHSYETVTRFEGHWVKGDLIIAEAKRLNCAELISTACKLPVLRIRLEC